jgi:FkbM family methyltransferase
MKNFYKFYFLIFFFNFIFSTDQALENILNKYRSTYLQTIFVNKINPKDINLILEIGVCECFGSISLHRYYNRPVYAFECNPRAIPDIKKRFKDFPQIHLVEKAVTDTTGIVPFYDSYWIADSSIYQFNLDTLSKINKGQWEKMSYMYNHQNKINVSSTRLDDWCSENNIDEIGLICMDIQGATLPALKGLGKYLQKVKYIITEVEYRPLYQGEHLFDAIFNFMQQNGFVCFNASSAASSVSNDVLFIRKDLIKSKLKATLATHIRL